MTASEACETVHPQQPASTPSVRHVHDEVSCGPHVQYRDDIDSASTTDSNGMSSHSSIRGEATSSSVDEPASDREDSKAHIRPTNVARIPTRTRRVQLPHQSQQQTKAVAGHSDATQSLCLESVPCVGNAKFAKGPCADHRLGIAPSENQEIHREAPRLAWQVQQQGQSLLTRRTKLLRHDMSLNDPVGGNPIHQGELMLMNGYTRELQPWSVLLFENGFYAISRNGVVQSFAWTPFSFLQVDPTGEQFVFDSPAFLLRLEQHGIACFFVVSGTDAETRRDKWVRAMTIALRSFTKSLFPSFALTVEPVDDKPNTGRRVLAGYLLLSQPDGQIIVPYCEVQAPSANAGSFVMYENSLCEHCIAISSITSKTHVEKLESFECSCFTLVSGLDRFQLCARTPGEADLWLRVISNIQAQCSHGTPEPTQEDVRICREAVLERIVMGEFSEAARRIGAVDNPRLQQVSSQLTPLITKKMHSKPAHKMGPGLQAEQSTWQRSLSAREETWQCPDQDALRLADEIAESIVQGDVEI